MLEKDKLLEISTQRKIHRCSFFSTFTNVYRDSELKIQPACDRFRYIERKNYYQLQVPTLRLDG